MRGKSVIWQENALFASMAKISKNLSGRCSKGTWSEEKISKKFILVF